jgi:hypothetical protein
MSSDHGPIVLGAVPREVISAPQPISIRTKERSEAASIKTPSTPLTVTSLPTVTDYPLTRDYSTCNEAAIEDVAVAATGVGAEAAAIEAVNEVAMEAEAMEAEATEAAIAVDMAVEAATEVAMGADIEAIEEDAEASTEVVVTEAASVDGAVPESSEGECSCKRVMWRATKTCLLSTGCSPLMFLPTSTIVCRTTRRISSWLR